MKTTAYLHGSEGNGYAQWTESVHVKTSNGKHYSLFEGKWRRVWGVQKMQ